MPGAADNPLLQAFNLLIGLATLERQEAVLRRGLLQLLGDPEPGPARSLVARSPAISTVDTAQWASIKPRIRAELELRRLTLFSDRDPGQHLAEGLEPLRPPTWPPDLREARGLARSSSGAGRK